MVSEKELLELISSGDIDAFEQIFFIYQPHLIYFLAGFIHDTETAKDMAQDVFLTLWQNRHKLAGIDSFSAYLFTIARFKIYNYFDHLVIKNKYVAYQQVQLEKFDTEEEKLFVKELQKQIDAAASDMSPQQERIYRMSREEGLSNDEIADILKISKRTVENHITSALSVIKKVINRYENSHTS